MKPQHTVTSDGSVVAKVPTFWGRVGSFMMGHALWSAFTGAFDLWSIFRLAGILLAIPLWLLGWNVRPPDRDKQPVHIQVEERFEIEKEKAIRFLQLEKLEAEERLKHGASEARRRFERRKDELADEMKRKSGEMIQDAGREARRGFFGW